jgi:hypothetical protein
MVMATALLRASFPDGVYLFILVGYPLRQEVSFFFHFIYFIVGVIQNVLVVQINTVLFTLNFDGKIHSGVSYGGL